MGFHYVAMHHITALLTAVICPLIGGLLEPLARSRGYLATLGNLVTAVVLTTLLLRLDGEVVVLRYGEIAEMPLELKIEPLMLELAVLTSWIVFLISLYSIGYMWFDYRRSWFWFFQNLIHVAILLLLLANDLVTLAVAWNLLELCSYALIGHWYRDEPERHVGEGFVIGRFRHLWSPSLAALRAVLITSIGTSALLLVIAYALSRGIYSLDELEALPVPAQILLLLAAATYSPLVPFTEWLYTAMAGPVPVSALIHSVTLVNAGAYLILKLGWILDKSLLSFFAVYALVSGLVSGIAGLGSREVKVILASSTLLYVSVLLYSASMYFLVEEPLREIAELAVLLLLAAHGFSKAALFTSCGLLMHLAGTRFVDDVKVFLRFRQGYTALVLASVNLFGLVFSTGMLLKEALLRLAVSSLVPLCIALTLVSTALLMKLLLYFLKCRREAQVITHAELPERFMEIASLILAIMPYALVVLFVDNLELLFEHIEMVIVSYVLTVLTILLCIYLFRSELYRKVPTALYTALKLRFGVAYLLDAVIAPGFRKLAQLVATTSSVLDRAIHSAAVYLRSAVIMYRADKVLDKALHAFLPHVVSKFSLRVALLHIRKLVVDYVYASMLTLIILVVCVCTCILLL